MTFACCACRAAAGYVDPKAIELCRVELGLDRSYVVQFLDFIWGFIRFDFGNSMWTGRPIVEEIALRFQLSLQIAIMATLTAVLLAIPLGTISAVKQNTWIDYVVRGFQHRRHRDALLLARHPDHPRPADHHQVGVRRVMDAADQIRAALGRPAYNLSMMIFPALATGYRYSAVATRMTRSALLEVLREDYVRTARAKGLVQKLIIRRHALKNALLPVVTIIGIEFAFLIGGLVVTEQVFNLNGLGKLFVSSVTNHDYAMTQALVMLVVAIFVFTNFLVDIVYAWLDPRIRYGK